MSLKDAIPDMGACSGIPDMGAWQFAIPDGLRLGAFRNDIIIAGALMGTVAGTGLLGSRPVAEGKFGADQA